jgi:hypothetical protein
MPMTEEEQVEYWARVQKCDNNGYDCWIWTGSFCGNGYGIFKVNGWAKYAHRISLEMKLGREIRPGLNANHTRMEGGHEPCCVNPDHLTEGPQSENMADRIADGRVIRHDFTDDQIRSIRADPRPQIVIAEQYGTTQPTISGIKNRKLYLHVV